MSRAMILKKQALERWKFNVPPAQQKELIEELRAWPRGQAVIELEEPKPEWKDGLATGRFCSKAQVVNITFGTSTGQSNKRYLFLSDIPPLPEESESKDPE